MNKRQLYNSIMESVSKQVKKTLNEATYKYIDEDVILGLKLSHKDNNCSISLKCPDGKLITLNGDTPKDVITQLNYYIEMYFLQGAEEEFKF